MADNEHNWGSVEKTATQPAKTESNPPAFHSDRAFYRMVAGCLGAVVVIAVSGAIYLAAIGQSIPEALIALGSGAIGALAGVLAGSKQ